MDQFIDIESRENFNRARLRETFSRIINSLTPHKTALLSLQEVRDLVQPRGESYRGLKAVPVDRIVGSEGRYRDFSKGFLPRHGYLRSRWTSVDRAHLQDIILPPITLYEIGGVYFVRDGNHRVSVARAQGVKEIDAEVVSLASQISIEPGWTRPQLLEAVVNYEKEQFYRRTQFDKLIPGYDLQFTAPGRYDEVLQHIYGHKYFINLSRSEEIPFEQAMISWYENVFRPIVDIVASEKLMARFPGRTAADLYVWTVRHWHSLKLKYGEHYQITDAVRDFSQQFGQGLWKRITSFFKGKGA